MKRIIQILSALIVATLANFIPLASGADVAVSGGIHLHIGGRYLQVGIDTTAPIIVYDGVYYRQTVETVSTLTEVVRDIPQTTAVAIPPNTTEILIDGVSYPLEPKPIPRTIEVVTGTVQKTVYEPQTVETTVYVPTETTSVTGAVYFVPSTIATAWFEIGGVTIVAGKPRPHFRACKPPTGVVVVNGTWRYRKGGTVLPLPRTPGRAPAAPLRPQPRGGVQPGPQRPPEPDYRRDRDDKTGHRDRR